MPRTDRHQVFSSTGALLAETVVVVDTTVPDNKRSSEQKLTDGLAEIATLIATTNATINANPAAYIKDIARRQRLLIRVALERHEASE